MTDDPADTAGSPTTVHVEVIGTIHDGSQPQRAVCEELPTYLAAEGITAELSYRHGGGMSLGVVETIAVYIGLRSVDGLIGDTATAAMKGAIKWARERLRREPPGPPVPTGVTGPDDPDNPARKTVRISLYGPRGELLKDIVVNSDEINTLFGDPVEDPDS